MLSYLNAPELCIVMQSCTWWYKRVSIDLIWKTAYARAFPTDVLTKEIHGIAYKELPWYVKKELEIVDKQ